MIVVFGGTRGVGLQAILQLLEKGCKVKTLARNISSYDQHIELFKSIPSQIEPPLSAIHPALEIVKGDALNEQDVSNVLNGAEKVFVSLGGNAKGGNVCSKGQEHISKFLSKNARMVVVSSFGVGDSYQHTSYLVRTFIYLVIKKAIQDKEIQEKSVRDWDGDWIILRPGGLKHGPKTGKYNVGEDLSGVKMIARADVAEFGVSQLLAEKSQYLKKAVTLLGQ